MKFVVMFVLSSSDLPRLYPDRVEAWSARAPRHGAPCVPLIACLLALGLTAAVRVPGRSGSVRPPFSASVSRLASSEATLQVSSFAIDTWREGRWDEKGTYVFYLELVTDLLHLFVYFCFFIIIFAYYGLPIHLIDLYSAFRNFNRGSRRSSRLEVTANLNERFPDATTEELALTTCIICRDDMSVDAPGRGPKKLPCGHIFHLRCLRTWMERRACTCRAPVEPEDLNAEPTRRDAREREVQAQLMNELFGNRPWRERRGRNAAGAVDPPAGAPPQGGAGGPSAASRGGRRPSPRCSAPPRRRWRRRGGERPRPGGAGSRASFDPPPRSDRAGSGSGQRSGPARPQAQAQAQAQAARRRRRGGGGGGAARRTRPRPRAPGFPRTYQGRRRRVAVLLSPPTTPAAGGTDSAAGVGVPPEAGRRSPRLRRTRSHPPRPPRRRRPRRRSSRSSACPRWVCWRRRRLAGQIAGLGFPPVAVADGTGGTAVHGSGGVRVETPTTAPTFSSPADASSSPHRTSRGRRRSARRWRCWRRGWRRCRHSCPRRVWATGGRRGGRRRGAGGGGRAGADETADAAPGGGVVEAAPAEEMVEAAPTEEGEIIPAMDADSEAGAIRRRRLGRFGANP